MLQRHRINMTSGEFFCVAIAILVLGVLVGWGLFSTPQLGPKLVLDNGNVADWLAAVGTWVIGFGAWKYARASHEHNLRSAKEAERKSLKSVLAELSSLSLSLTRANGPIFLFETFSGHEEVPDDEKEAAFVPSLKHALTILRAANWNGQWKSLLDADLFKHLSRCELHCRFFEFRGQLLIDEIEAGAAVNLDAPVVHSLRLRAAQIAEEVKPLTEFAIAERTRVLEALKKLDG